MDKVQLDILIANAAAYKSSIDTINDYIDDLLFKKRSIEYQIEDLDTKAAPLKDEVSQIEGEINRVMRDSLIDKVKSSTYTVTYSPKFKASITDTEKFLEYAKKYPAILLKQSIKETELKKLVDDGIVPSEEESGIKIDNSLRVFKYIKAGTKND